MRLPIKRNHALVTVILCVAISLVRILRPWSDREGKIGQIEEESGLHYRPARSHNDVDADVTRKPIDSNTQDEKIVPRQDQEPADEGQDDESESEESEIDIPELFELDEGGDGGYSGVVVSDGDRMASNKKPHEMEPWNQKQKYIIKRLNGFIRELSNCNSSLYSQTEVQKNVLCATPETVLSYPPIDRYVISGVNNPCFFLRQGNRERGDHGWSLKLTSPNINVMDGAKTLSMYKVNCLPGVYLAGFPKSGTTELHAKLSEHHQVHGALRKEVAWLDNGKSYERFFGPGGESTFSLYAYMRMFGVASQSIENDIVRRQAELLEAELSDNDDAKPKRQGDRSRNDHDDKSLSRSVLIDSSPGNYVVEHLHKIAHLLPNSKVIFIMRDPVEREFSRYRFAFQLTKRKKFGEKFQNPESFHKYVVQQMNRTNPLRTSTSRYHIYIEAALQYFNREHLLFLMFEEFIEDPLAVIERKVLPFLGLDKYHPAVRRRMTKAMSSGSHANSSKKSYKMLYKTRILLMKYFSPFNRRLADVLGDDIWTWGY